MGKIPTLHLNDGHGIPQLGLGTWQTPSTETAQVILGAFKLGYRHVDTAMIYGNEQGVGQAIAQSGIDRTQLFITSKLWNADQGYDAAQNALDASLDRLQLDYLDLYLIHWPCPANGKFVDSWKALVRARQEGKVRSIGVSNFRTQDIERIVQATGVIPAVNQIELHPLLQQAELRTYDAAHGIVTEAWSPLAQGGALLRHPALQAIATHHVKSTAQVILRWHVQLGLVVFPKSVTPARIAENVAIFDFELGTDEMAAIAALDAGQRLGPDPSTLS